MSDLAGSVNFGEGFSILLLAWSGFLNVMVTSAGLVARTRNYLSRYLITQRDGTHTLEETLQTTERSTAATACPAAPVTSSHAESNFDWKPACSLGKSRVS